MTTRIHLYDTTLRDGTQREGISLSASDKVKIAARLDAFGIDTIEGGWPGSNPKDAEFFRRVRSNPPARARIAAFGSTHRVGLSCAEDPSIQALVAAETEARATLTKADSLVANVRSEIAQIKKLRNSLISQGVDERLAGKPETTARELAQIDAKLTIETRALEGAERKQAELEKALALEEFPERIRLADVAMRRARARLAELRWLAHLAEAKAAGARYIAGRRLTGHFDDEVTVRPSRILIDAAAREIEAEMRGEE